MSEEETLALDAMRADNIIDLETRQQYEALNDAAMGDWMSTDDDKAYERVDTYTDSVGVRYQSVTDVRTGVKKEVIRDYERVVPTPTFPERMKQIAYEITGIAGRLRPGPEANRLYDLAFEIDQLFLNQK